MLTVACCLWDANLRSRDFSRCYDESWVDKLYRGFARNLTVPFRFVAFVDRHRRFVEDAVDQELLNSKTPDYGCYIEPFRLDDAMIIVGLDTVVVGNIDHLADYCLTKKRLALPQIDGTTNNGVALVPAGCRRIYDDWNGTDDDMTWLRKQDRVPIDVEFPGQVVSYKLHVRPNGLGDARVVYFHGEPKPPSLLHLDWVMENWR